MYSKRAFQVILLLLLALLAWGQKKPAAKGPRATALVVLSPDGKTATRLIPICIRDNGQFWDASIYQASPRPMALDFGVVYEVERTGNPVGLFTISQPVQENGAWIALGSWQPPQARLGARTSPTSDDERPVLRRAPSSSGSGAAAPPPELATPPSVASDPDRPVLQRGKPAELPQPPPPSVPAATASPRKPPSAKPPEMLPAISDAGGPEPRPFVLDRNADDQSRLRKAANALLETAVLKQAGMTPQAARLVFQDDSVRFFDLDGNNGAELVLTARLELQPQAPPRRRPVARPSSAPSAALREFYVTFIAREDLEGELHPAYTRITDARNLDLDGRLELIDAVDVDGDDRGELLFRRLIGKDISFLVLKVGLSQTTKLFDSAGE